MARRRKAKRRKSPKTLSLINVAESYAYAQLLTGGLMGTTPVGFITGAADISTTGTGASMVVSGAGAISLGDIVANPGVSFDSMQSNFMSNYQMMAVQAIGIGVTFKFAKRLLRKPVANVNRNIFRPLGIGVRL